MLGSKVFITSGKLQFRKPAHTQPNNPSHKKTFAFSSRTASTLTNSVHHVEDTNSFVKNLWPHTFEHPVINFQNEKVGTIKLDSEIFKVPVRTDLLHRVVTWQLACRRRGTASAKTRGDVSGTGKKPYKQKGTGHARAGTLRAPHMRGGGTAFAPKPKDWSYDLPKQVRRMALKVALSSKLAQNKLFILDDATLSSKKTKDFVKIMSTFGWSKGGVLIGSGATSSDVSPNLALASSNIHAARVLPGFGLNVYDILHQEYLCLTKSCVEYLQQKRLVPKQS